MAKRKARAADNTWRKLTGNEQAGRKRTVVSRSRWKLYTVVGVLLLICAALGAVFLSSRLSAPAVTIPQPIPEEKLQRIVLRTDGVLREEQIWQLLGLSRSDVLSELDIFALKHQLEVHGQVRTAVIERRYPDALVVEVEERQPVLRLMTIERGARQVLLVSSEGVVFRGVNYAAQTLRHLPFLDLPPGSLRRKEVGYVPLTGIGTVAALLELAQVHYPHIYARWRIVNLHQYDASPAAVAPLIRIHTTDKVDVVFIAENFAQQLERLDYILQHTAEIGQGKVQMIDMSLNSPVVRFAEE